MGTSRYIRQTMLPQVGDAGQQHLAQARVLVVGAGGLGCPVLQYLVAAGVGHITVADGDTVSTSNLHRQVLYGPADLNLNKAEVAVLRLASQNPDVTLVAEPGHLHPWNAMALIGAHDLILDCTDNMAARYLVNDVCVRLGKPFVHGSIHRFEGQVAVFNHEGSATYRCAFPETATSGQIQNCAEAGVIGVLPGTIGCLQANEALKVILGLDGVLSGRIMTLDLLRNTQMVIVVPRDPYQIQIAMTGEFRDNPSHCKGSPVRTIDLDGLLSLMNEGHDPLLVDVRQPGELPEVTSFRSIRIPMTELEERYDELPTDRTLVLFCMSGVRSMICAGILSSNGFMDLYSLTVGAEAIEHVALAPH